jgi:spermidine synthase
LPLLFATTLFVSATLLFLVQPMVAKMILPLLGGTPAVWNTCMVFFQAALLGGYAYAHATTARLGIRRQVILHAVLLVLAFVALPISTRNWLPPNESNPIPWLLTLLVVCVGLPFFVLSSTAPLLQKWFVYTGHARARDPYFLYAASNLGSMLALLSYPVLVEPYLPLKPDHWVSQSMLWTAGYGMLVLLLVLCASPVWRNATAIDKERAFEPSLAGGDERRLDPGPTGLTKLRWVALAFVPSSMMLGATTYITLDIAAFPLLWIIPLALYLLSFILVFAKWPDFLHKAVVLAMPLLLLLVIFLHLADTLKGKIEFVILLHLLTLFVVALVCHGELARSRPSTRYLTEFYLLMSLGGVLGGMFNALLAPLIFSSAVEYYLAMVVACMLLPGTGLLANTSLLRSFLELVEGPGHPSRLRSWLDPNNKDWEAVLVRAVPDVMLAALIGVITFLLAAVTSRWSAAADWLNPDFHQWVLDKFASASDSLNFKSESLKALVALGLPTLLCYACVTRPFRFGLAVGAFLLGATYGSVNKNAELVLKERSFFGILTVRHYSVDDSYTLSHGTTLHGEQIFSNGQRDEPQTYYHKTGPIGQVFEDLHDELANKHLAFIGLGTGTLACYGEPGQQLTFYDIDPTVVYIARDSGYFTYLADCRAKYDIELGDARLRIMRAADASYKLIVVDAFSSDAIPVHLITREAIELYFRKLTKDGILAVHISNRHLDLSPVLANVAEALGLSAIRRQDDEDDEIPNKSASDWVLLARQESYFGKLREDLSPHSDDGKGAESHENKHWRRPSPNPRVGVWTDDFSNILSVFLW